MSAGTDKQLSAPLPTSLQARARDSGFVRQVDATNFYTADGICGFIQYGKTCNFKRAAVDEIKKEKRSRSFLRIDEETRDVAGCLIWISPVRASPCHATEQQIPLSV